MWRTKNDLEIENDELWRILEEVYDRLGELFEGQDEDDDEADEAD